MESLNSLKNRFITLRQTADGRYARGDYQGAMKGYEEAAELLDEIYRREISAKNKEAYVDISKDLQARYDECKRNLGLKVTTKAPAKPVPSAPRPAPRQAAPAKPGAAPQGKAPQGKQPVEDENLTYDFEIGGDTINVRSFLGDASSLNVFFDDVVGMEQAKKIARKEFFATDEQREFRQKIKAKPKNFILLYGLPGTGKTYFAIALSNELRQFYGESVPFISILGSTLKSGTPGLMEKNIKAVFEYVKQFDRCVLFFDEFDSIAMSRQKPTGDPTDRAAVTTLIQLLGGFCSNPNLLVLAATNTPYDIDGAILSRATLKFEVPLPSKVVLAGVLKHGIGDLIDDTVDLEEVAEILEKKKYSNRDCSNLIEVVKDLLSDANEEDPNIEYINEDIMEQAIASFQPTVVEAEERKLRAFTAQNAN